MRASLNISNPIKKKKKEQGELRIVSCPLFPHLALSITENFPCGADRLKKIIIKNKV